MCIIQFFWLIPIFLFVSLVCNTSFLIVKNSGVREDVSDVKNYCARTSCWWVLAWEPPLWFMNLPNWHFPFHLPPLRRPGICAVDNSKRFRFGSLPTNSQERVKKESTFTLKFTLRTIYEVNGKARYLKRCWPATNNDAILAALLHHNEDNFLKLMAKNRTKIDLNKSVPNKW